MNERSLAAIADHINTWRVSMEDVLRNGDHDELRELTDQLIDRMVDWTNELQRRAANEREQGR